MNRDRNWLIFTSRVEEKINKEAKRNRNEATLPLKCDEIFEASSVSYFRNTRAEERKEGYRIIFTLTHF